MEKNDSLVQRYEEIRQVGMSRHYGETRWGLAVLQAKGMAAWTRSWQDYGAGGLQWVQPRNSAPTERVIPQATDEIVLVIAGMVWAVQEETVP